jgi:hypothetical protein
MATDGHDFARFQAGREYDVPDVAALGSKLAPLSNLATSRSSP